MLLIGKPDVRGVKPAPGSFHSPKIPHRLPRDLTLASEKTVRRRNYKHRKTKKEKVYNATP